MLKRRKRPTGLQSRGWQGRVIFTVAMALSRLLMKLEYIGQEHLPKEGAYLIAPNHQTMFDGLWVMGGVPRQQLPRFSCVAGDDLIENYGLTGRIMMRVGKAIPMDRTGGSPLRGIALSLKQLRKGSVVLIHPEGTRTRDGRVGPLKNGIAFLSRKTGVPIIPTYIDGGYQIFSRYMAVPHPIDWKHFRRKKMTITFSEPLFPQNYENEEQLMDELSRFFQEMEAEAFARREASRS